MNVDMTKVAFVDTDHCCALCGEVMVPRYKESAPRFRRRQFCSYSCSAKSRPARKGASNPNWRGGKTSHPLYETYMDMVGRCGRPTHLRFSDYGGRGIRVCDRWLADFWNYATDVGQRPDGTSLDRINNDDGYHPGNVRWATTSEQARNKRPGWMKRDRSETGQFV